MIMSEFQRELLLNFYVDDPTDIPALTCFPYFMLAKDCHGRWLKGNFLCFETELSMWANVALIVLKTCLRLSKKDKT